MALTIQRVSRKVDPHLTMSGSLRSVPESDTFGLYSPFHVHESELPEDQGPARDAESMHSTDEGLDSFLLATNSDAQGSYGSADDSEAVGINSLNYIFNNVLRLFRPTFGSIDGITAQVSAMFNASSDDSHVRSAVNALTMERIGLDNSNQDVLAQAQAEYGRTLLKVREALGDPIESRRDETLATIQLLCHFELLRSVTDNVPFTNTHGDAVPLLLKHRGAQQLQSERSREMFLCFQNRLLLYCIDRWYSLEDLLGEFSEIPEAPEDPVVRLMAVAREVNRVQMQIATLKAAVNQDRDSIVTTIREVLRTGRDVDNSLHHWSVSLEPDLHYNIADADDVLIEPQRYSDQIHAYPGVAVARIWNGWRTVRINLQGAINDLLNWAQAALGIDLPQERQYIHNVTQIMVDEVCNSVHYLLGNKTTQDPQPIAQFPVQGPSDLYEKQTTMWSWFHLLVPLRTCAKSSILLPRQRQWIQRSLIRISRIACQLNNRQPPTNPPVLITEALPSNAFSLPMFSLLDYRRSSVPSLNSEMESFSFENQARHSPASLPGAILPSQRTDYFGSGTYSSAHSSGSPSHAASTPPAKSESQQVDLPFFNTTRPDQIKDPDVQKQIRRGVMLHHMRTQDPKQREERQRKARAGSAARAASRREQSASLSRERRESGEEVPTVSGSKSRRTPSKKPSSSSKSKDRAG